MKRAIELQTLPEKPTDRMYLIRVNGGKCDGVHLAKRIGTKKWTMICVIPGSSLSDENWVFTGNYPNLKNRIAGCNVQDIWEINSNVINFRKILMNLLIWRDPNTIIVSADNTLIFKEDSD